MSSGDRDLLKSEYFHVQNVIESFDSKALAIKAWSVTFSLTAVVVWRTPLELGRYSSFRHWHRWRFGSWRPLGKRYQIACYNRSTQLESYFAGKDSHVVPLQISGQLVSGVEERRLAAAPDGRVKWSHVANPHVFVVGLACVAALSPLLRFGGDQLGDSEERVAARYATVDTVVRRGLLTRGPYRR